jgi:hypothetical protein
MLFVKHLVTCKWKKVCFDLYVVYTGTEVLHGAVETFQVDLIL